uniref:Uncharacterized protein n=1 Tax=Salix viminalis TaxID=40686 RepID=A0A6N2LZY3_SALVM
MSSVQDPFYICERGDSRICKLTSCNLLFTNGNGFLVIRERKCILQRICLLLVRALSGRFILIGRWMNWTKLFL